MHDVHKHGYILRQRWQLVIEEHCLKEGASSVTKGVAEPVWWMEWP